MLRNNFYSSIGVNQSSTNELPITVAECAKFSSLIYDEKPVTPPGWELLHLYDDPITGYRGACYVRDLLTINTKLLYVHRGTVLNFANIVGDIQLALGHAPVQCDSAVELIKIIIEKIKIIYKDKNDLLPLIRNLHTGHSLGAILSDYCAGGGVDSITFENPGSKPIIRMVLEQKGFSEDNIKNYLARLSTYCNAYQGGVNIINTCNEQTGRTFRIYLQKDDYDYEAGNGAYFPVPSSFLLNLFYVIGNTSDQHKIEKIVKKFNSADFMCEQILNPIGVNAGYVEYLDEKNRVYWNNYFTAVWDKNPKIHEEYENDVNKYMIWSYAKLNKIQQEAKSILIAPPKEKMFNNTFVLFNPEQEKEDEFLKSFVMVENKSNSKGCIIL